MSRHRTARLIFLSALLFNTALTVFWLATFLRGGSLFYSDYRADWGTIGRILSGVFFFYVVWGFVWWAVKTALLRYFVGFTKEERRDAFSSRMKRPYDVSALTAKYSERRIRIADMITSWIFLGVFYVDGLLGAFFYGAQSRVMDGVLARANNLLITSLWTLFRFVMVPIGTQLAAIFPRTEFAVVFALIWGSYLVADGSAEIVGSLFGKQRLRVWGVGDVNRKSVAGTVAAFLGALILCVTVVTSNGLGVPWLFLSVILATSNCLLELYSPRGTDDFTMGTTNALICWAFGSWLY
jgi:dolichol kinase